MIKPSFWNQSGPVLLLGAFLALTLKCAPIFTPLASTAFAGYLAIQFWKKGGLYFSLATLVAVAIFTSGDPLWRSVFSSSIALSWLLILLGQQEWDAFALAREEEKKSLEENRTALQKELSALKLSIAEENRKNIAEKERTHQLYVQVVRGACQAKLYLDVAEKERDKLHAKCEALLKDNADAQRDLEELRSKVVPVNITDVIPQEEDDPQEKAELELAQRQYALLREQFDEKTDALDKTRERLFRTENELMAMQRAQEESGFEFSDEDRHLLNDLQRLEEECSDLEAQVVNLQEFISTLLSPKKRTTVRTRKASDSQERLPLLIQAKIDQSSLSDSDGPMATSLDSSL
jgi:hypothetical protein